MGISVIAVAHGSNFTFDTEVVSCTPDNGARYWLAYAFFRVSLFDGGVRVQRMRLSI